MDKIFNYIDSYNEKGKATLIGEPPAFCPYCEHNTDFRIMNCYLNSSKMIFTFFLKCPKCENYSIWKTNQSHDTLSFIPHAINIEKAPKSIMSISPNFIATYEESQAADNANLHNICGIGYRKALEFLIKDYLIYIFPDKNDIIAKETLMQSIKRIPQQKIQILAEKTAWLGNDEAHFIKKHFQNPNVFLNP